MPTKTTTINNTLGHLLEPHPYTGELVTLRHVAQVNSICQELNTLFRGNNRNRNGNSNSNRNRNKNSDFPKPSTLKRRTNNNSHHSDSDNTEASEEEGERMLEAQAGATTPVYDGYVYSTVDYFGIPKEIPRLYNPDNLMDEYEEIMISMGVH